MHRPVAKWPVSATDIWGALTLVLFIVLIYTLAAQPFSASERLGLTVSSNAPVPVAGRAL